MRFNSDRDCIISSCGEGETQGIIVYDLRKQEIDLDLTLYSRFLARKKHRDHKTILDGAYSLRTFREYLIVERIAMSNLWEVNLERFRDHQYKKLVEKGSRGSKRTRRATVNSKLLTIYEWLHWMKDTERCDEFLIGSKACRIPSSKREQGRSGVRGVNQAIGPRFCPVLFKKVGKGSRHKLPNFVPSEETRALFVEELSKQTATEFLVQRNLLFQEIVNTTGLRRESVNGLRAAQFAESVLRLASDDYVYVTPDIQKFDYEARYDFPIWLALRVSNFIADYLNPLMQQRGWSTKHTEDAIFISYTTGTPLTGRTITRLFSEIFRRLGSPPGVAVHALRHKFVHEEIEKETQYRLSQELDTSVASIALAVSLKIGQQNSESLQPYVVSVMSTRKPSSASSK